jgi:hypothetical protein
MQNWCKSQKINPQDLRKTLISSIKLVFAFTSGFWVSPNPINYVLNFSQFKVIKSKLLAILTLFLKNICDTYNQLVYKEEFASNVSELKYSISLSAAACL